MLLLFLSKSYSNKLEDLTANITLAPEKEQSEVELLIERIQAIQREIKEQKESISEEAQAFNEAAEEHFVGTDPHKYGEKSKIDLKKFVTSH